LVLAHLTQEIVFRLAWWTTKYSSDTIWKHWQIQSINSSRGKMLIHMCFIFTKVYT